MRLGQSVYRLKESLSIQNERRLAVDIDDTLANTTAKYFDVLSQQFPPPEDLTPLDVKKQFGLDGQILYWGKIPAAMELAHSYVNDNGFHSDLAVVPGAVEALQTLHQSGELACYLTARVEPMRQITDFWLKGVFPDLPLVLKDPSIDFSNGSAWKVAALEFLYPEINGLIDNDARTIRTLEENGYPGELYLIGLTSEDYPSYNAKIHLAWSGIVNEIIS